MLLIKSLCCGHMSSKAAAIFTTMLGPSFISGGRHNLFNYKSFHWPPQPRETSTAVPLAVVPAELDLI
jgi:hypothetical protein